MFQGWNSLFMKSSSSSDSDYSLWRHSRELINKHHKICILKIWNISLTSLPACFFTRYEIRDIHLVEESVLESLKVKANFHNFKPRPFNMREFYDRTGHDINDMLLSCHFHGTECRPEDFKVVSCLQKIIVMWQICSCSLLLPTNPVETKKQKWFDFSHRFLLFLKAVMKLQLLCTLFQKRTGHIMWNSVFSFRLHGDISHSNSWRKFESRHCQKTCCQLSWS